MNNLYGIIFVSLITCSLSSGWLYSSLFSEFREWWLTYYKGRKIEHLAICQLCCSFWFALPITFLVFETTSITGLVLASLSAALVSWGIGTWITNQLWQRAYYKKLYEKIDTN